MAVAKPTTLRCATAPQWKGVWLGINMLAWNALKYEWNRCKYDQALIVDVKRVGVGVGVGVDGGGHTTRGRESSPFLG